MTFEEYYPLALRTANDLQSVVLNSIHATLGMGSELVELLEAIEKNDLVGIGEELSDIMWYIALYKNTHELDFNSKSNESSSYDILNIIKCISKLQDLDKKEFIYIKKILEDSRLENINKLISLLYQTYNFYGLNSGICLQNNINKLKIRYPNKFSERNAIIRDLASERKALEKDI